MNLEIKDIKELIESKRGDDYTALIDPVTDEKVSYNQFYEETALVGRLLLKNGCRQGDRVAVAYKNSLDAAIAELGIIRYGAVLELVNLGWKESELSYALEDSNCRFIVSDDETLSEMKAGGIGKCLGRYRNVGLYEVTFYKDEEGNEPLIEKEDALLLYTSGTTGKPKGVILSNHNLISHARYVTEAHKLTREDTALQVLPLFHINGFSIAFLSSFYAGATVIMPNKFSASRFWQWVRKYDVRWASAVPTIISMIMARTGEEENGFGRMRFIRSASAPLAVAVLENWERRFGIPIVEAYGISEGSGQIATNPVDGLRRAGSVGRPVGNIVEIVDASGHKLVPFEKGEVRIKGDNIFRAYYNKPLETEKSLRDGWFYTGDIGYLDNDGYLYLDGRVKEMINRAGEKFSPREIDEMLYKIDGVELAAAVGVPDPVYNECVVAFVKKKEGSDISSESVIDHLKGKLADFKIPKEVIFIDEFPKGPSGKIQRLKLVDRYKDNLKV